MGIVVDLPSFNLLARMIERKELSDVQTFIAEPAIEGFYVLVLRGLSWLREVELYASLIGSFLKRVRGEPRAVIRGDRHWCSVSANSSPLWH